MSNRVIYYKTKDEIEDEKKEPLIKTVEEYNALYHAIKDNQNWFAQMLSLCKHYYESEPTGGALHIVLEDGNLQKNHIQWCAGYAAGCQDYEAVDIANLMIAMTMKQKTKLYKNLHKCA